MGLTPVAAHAPARFLAALAFLSRLAPARVVPEADMRHLMFHLPLCGLVVGLAACAPAMLSASFGLFAASPLIPAWLCVLLAAWLTRGLHLDGLADIMDAAGQHLDPERFWTIIKDSRSGAFGVMAVALATLGQAALLAEALRTAKGLDLLALPWCLVFGRSCAVLLGRAGRGLARPGLGGLFLSGATNGAAAWALILALGPALAFWPLATVLAAGMALAALCALLRLARAVGGLNGDFLGAAIVLGETAAAAGLALAAQFPLPHP